MLTQVCSVGNTRVSFDVFVACEGEQLVKMVDRVYTHEAAYTDAHQCCYEADQRHLRKVSFTSLYCTVRMCRSAAVTPVTVYTQSR